MQWQNSISFKFLAPLVLISGLTLSVFYVNFNYSIHSLIDNFSEKRAYELAEQVTLNIETNTKSSNLSRVITSIGSYEDVDIILLIDLTTEQILASNKNSYTKASIKDLDKLDASLLEHLNFQNTQLHHIDDTNETLLSYKFNAVSEDRRSIKPLLLVLRINENQLRFALDNVSSHLLLLLILGMLLSILCLFLITRFFIFKPISQLIHHINHAKETKKALSITHSSNDEIGTLFKQYNELMTSLNEYSQHLIQAKERSDAATKAKSEFLATMTHELRTPLNGVIGVSDLLKKSALDSEQYNYVDVINQSGVQLLGIINDILDFSKIESGKLILSSVTFNLPQLIRQTCTMLEVQATEKGLTISFESDKELTQDVIGDDVRLRQILLNIIGNAIKFTHNGGINIKLESTLDDQNSIGDFRIHIVDTGIGLSQAQLETLFERFTQADASTTRKYGGTGLGLAICKSIIDKMGGTIDIYSEPDKGTEFVIHFELQLAQKTFAQETTQTFHTLLEPFQQRDKVKEIDAFWSDFCQQKEPNDIQLLIVDDTEINLLIASSLLESLGFKVTTASHGYEAIERYEQHSFDLILMDCLMPKMDGYDATRAIREIEAASSDKPTVVIALTASALEETKKSCIDAGMDDFVTKPFDSEILISTIKWWLIRHHSR